MNALTQETTPDDNPVLTLQRLYDREYNLNQAHAETFGVESARADPSRHVTDFVETYCRAQITSEAAEAIIDTFSEGDVPSQMLAADLAAYYARNDVVSVQFAARALHHLWGKPARGTMFAVNAAVTFLRYAERQADEPYDDLTRHCLSAPPEEHPYPKPGDNFKKIKRRPLSGSNRIFRIV